MSPRPEILVVAPAYLDDVCLVDGPLVPPVRSADSGRIVLDHSVLEAGRETKTSQNLLIRSPVGEVIEISNTTSARLPVNGTIEIDRFLAGSKPWHNHVGLVSHLRLPGGMGAGYAAALKATLVAPLGGSPSGRVDDTGLRVLGLLEGVACRFNRSSWLAVPAIRRY